MRIGRKVVRDNARIVTKMTRISHFWQIAHMGTVKNVRISITMREQTLCAFGE